MYLSEILNPTHNKIDFSCGKESLDYYLKNQATQDIKRKLSVCFILPDSARDKIKGFYTLSNSSIPLDFVPESIRHKIPKSYKSIPATLIGRLAIDNAYKKQGLGKLLLIDALKRSYSTSKIIGSFAVIVDPLDDEAESFYRNYGFIKLPDSGKMFLPMKTVEQLFTDKP
jgi:GNAT superfamily N-acetyltransferase